MVASEREVEIDINRRRGGGGEGRVVKGSKFRLFAVFVREVTVIGGFFSVPKIIPDQATTEKH